MLKGSNLQADRNYCTNLKSRSGAVWNAVRAQKYVSQIQEILSDIPELKNIRKPMGELRKEIKSVNKDAKKQMIYWMNLKS